MMHGAGSLSLQQYLPAVVVLDLPQRRLSGAENVDLLHVRPAEEEGPLPRDLRDLRFLPSEEEEKDQTSERRIPEFPPVLHLCLREGQEMVCLCAPDRLVAGRVRLDDHLAGEGPSARSTRDLSQQLKCPLAGPKVGEVQSRVRGDDTHERNARKIQSLGHHLRA